MAKKCLVIGTETLSRVTDEHDRDSMIYADGAGACIVEASLDVGVIAHETASYTYDEVYHLFFGNSNNKSRDKNVRFIKMYGRKIYEFALNNVPSAMKACLDSSGYGITDVKKILIHQANEKMDEAIVKRFYRLYKTAVPPDLSYIALARHGGEDYIFHLLTSYCDAPAGVEVPEGQHFNPYMLGGKIAMAAPLYNEVIEYEDGTPATLSQLAKDVCTFLVWSASPEHDERKQIGIKAQIVCATMFGLVLYVKRHKWSVLKTQKIVFNPKK